MKKVRYYAVLGILLIFSFLMLVNLAYSDNGLTGNKILQKVEEQEEEVMGGDLITFIRFDTVNPDGTTSSNVFRGLGKSGPEQTDKSLIYFLEPKDVRGTLFLSIDPEEGDSRIWLYLPALGTRKELISEEEREKSFAGSTFSYEDIGERSTVDDFNGKVVGEEVLTVEDQELSCYVLKLEAKPDAEIDYPTGKTWVSKDSLLTLKSEYYNQAGNLVRAIEVLALGEFEGKTVSKKMINKNILEDSSTTITFQRRIRPEGEIPDSVFEPENLPNFDPTKWGFTE